MNGVVAGVWEHRRQGRGWRVVVEPFQSLSNSTREGIAAEAEDLGRFLGGAVDLDYARAGAG
jgi:hypothetical protein